LCIPHHDAYDTKTSQSKGLTPAELLAAKKSLYEYLKSDSLSHNDVFRMTLTIDGHLGAYTQSEQQHLLATLLPPLMHAATVSMSDIQDGRRRVFVELSANDAAHLCKSYNEGSLAPEITNVELTPPPRRRIEISELFDERNCGVSPQQAMESIRSHDGEMLLSGNKEVAFSAARCGLYTKHFGKSQSDRYTIIVITAIDEHKTTHVYGALRADHNIVRMPDSPSPVQSLKAFLDVFGVEVAIPRLGKSSLFLGERVTVPGHIATEQDFLKSVGLIVSRQSSEAFAMVSNVKKSEIGPFVVIHLLVFFARDRYLKAIGR